MSPFVIKGKVAIGVNAEVIHIDFEPTFGDYVSKDMIHKCLKGRWGVTKTKEHDSWFKKTKQGDKGSLPLVGLFDTYVVIPPVDVELGEPGKVFHFID